MEYLSRVLGPFRERDLRYVIGASVVITVAVLAGSRRAFRGQSRKVIRGPKTTLLPGLDAAAISALPYPPDCLPGARDVESLYGTVRVYEWGPEEGRKVLLVHGITTPCLALGAVAHGLVDRGCRVMLFDLWGRGYSDSCADLEHDDRLYATQILIALTSSPLSWTGGSGGGFSLIGYSLGGGISAAFASSFPALVTSLVLFAPTGLIRPEHMSAPSRFRYSQGLVPEGLLQWFVRRRLQAGPMYARENKDPKPDVAAIVAAEAQGDTSVAQAPLSRLYPHLVADEALQWQLSHHDGFVHSFISSIRFAPITAQHAAWGRLALRPDKTLFFAGTTDPIILPGELRPDAEALLGKDKVEWRLINGAHDFPITDSVEVVREICAFWGI